MGTLTVGAFGGLIVDAHRPTLLALASTTCQLSSSRFLPLTNHGSSSDAMSSMHIGLCSTDPKATSKSDERKHVVAAA